MEESNVTIYVDAVDYALIGLCRKGDLVVTQSFIPGGIVLIFQISAH